MSFFQSNPWNSGYIILRKWCFFGSVVNQIFTIINSRNQFTLHYIVLVLGIVE